MIKPSKIYKMRIVFCVSEEGPKRQDTLDALRKMILTSGLAYMPAKVNVHWPRLSYGPLVGKGQTALREYVDIYLRKPVSAQEVQRCLTARSPKGLKVLAVSRVPYALASLQQLAAAAVYEVQGDFASYTPTQTIDNFITSSRLEFMQRAANGMQLTTDVKPFVRHGRTLDAQHIELTLTPVKDKWMNPLAVVYAWLGIEATLPVADLTDERFKVIRAGLYWQDSQNNLHLI